MDWTTDPAALVRFLGYTPIPPSGGGLLPQSQEAFAQWLAASGYPTNESEQSDYSIPEGTDNGDQ